MKETPIPPTDDISNLFNRVNMSGPVIDGLVGVRPMIAAQANTLDLASNVSSTEAVNQLLVIDMIDPKAPKSFRRYLLPELYEPNIFRVIDWL